MSKSDEAGSCVASACRLAHRVAAMARVVIIEIRWVGKATFLAAMFACMLFVTTRPLHAQAPSGKALDKVVLQLTWHHEFQFAGYYAARMKGYYAEEGLDVEIRDRSSGQLPVDAVLKGEADFGNATSDIVLLRMQGKPVVVLACIMQHSPWAILVRADSGIKTLEDLIGKTVSMDMNYRDVELRAMFRDEHVPMERMKVVKKASGVDNLINGKVDARASYISDQPFALREKGVEPRVIRPISYGIDFYGDTLFTSERQISEHPRRVAAFRRASLRGWRYAMEHPEELVEHIYSTYYADPKSGAVSYSREHLRFEAKVMADDLMHPVLIEIGHINPQRWRRIADTYAEMGMADPIKSLDDFIYDPNPKVDYRWLYVVAGLLAGVVFVGALARLWNRRLRRAVTQRTGELQESNKKRQRLVGNLTETFLYRHNVDGVFNYVSTSITRVLGYSSDEFMAHFSEYLTDHPVNREVMQRMAQSMSGVPQPSYEVEVYHKDRSARWLELSETPVRDPNGNIVAVEGVAHDITNRKHGEELLRRIVEATSSQVGTALFKSMAMQLSSALKADYVLIGELQRGEGESIRTIAVTVDGKLADNFEYDLAGTPCQDVADESVCCHVSGVAKKFPDDVLLGQMGVEGYVGVPLFDSQRAVLGIMAVMFREPVANPEFSKTILQIFSSRVGSELERFRTEADRERLTNELRQAQKLEAVGQLAGGVAHDFNNLLTVILGFGQMAQKEAQEGSPIRGFMDEVLKAGHRAATLVKQLLAFSRRQVLEMGDIDLNEVIADLMTMLRSVIGEHITLDVLVGHDLGTVRADRGQMAQILTNLCVNARDAMSEGGTITIETENVRIDQAYCQSHDWASPGRYVLLSVTDSGHGMGGETLGQVFEPFFTTKEVGKGTGLGLSTVYGLIRQHDGLIHVYSEIDKGTTFKIYLPLIERAATVVGDKIEGAIHGGTETILLAEDDEMVLKVAKAFLEKVGYTVLTARDGTEAMDVFDASADKIDLAILDVVMPKLGGHAVFDQIRAKHTEIRILFASGYSMNAIHTNFILDEGLTLIQKPYQRADLLRKVRQTLDQE